MFNLNKIWHLVLAVSLLMCGCKDEKLPPKTIKNSPLVKLYDYFLELEQENYAIANLVLSEIKDPDQLYIYQQIYASYRNPDFTNTLKQETDEEKMAQLIIKTNTLDTSGLYLLYQDIAEDLDQIHDTKLLLMYLVLLNPSKFEGPLQAFFDEFKIEDLKSQSPFNKIIQVVMLQQLARIRHLEEERINYHAYLFHLLSSGSVLNDYPKLWGYILNNVSSIYAVRDDGTYDENNATFCVNQINDYLKNKDDSRWRLDFDLWLAKLYFEDSLLAKLEIQDTLMVYAERKYMPARLKAKMYIQLGTSLSSFYDIPQYRKLSINYLKKAADISKGQPCTSGFIFILEYLDHLVDASTHETIMNDLSLSDQCDQLTIARQIYKIRLMVRDNLSKCLGIQESEFCIKGIELSKNIDSLMHILYEGQDELHLSDYYAFSAHQKFLFFKHLSTISDSDKWKEEAFNLLQSTKFRIFAYQNIYDKIYPPAILQKIKKAEERLSAAKTAINFNETFAEPEEFYLELVDAQYDLNKIKSEFHKKDFIGIENPVSVYAIQDLLEENNAQLLEFYNYGENLWVFAAQKDTVFFEEIKDLSFLSFTDTLLKIQRDFKTTFPKNKSSLVFNGLLLPYLDTTVKNLILIPDGKLTGLAFESLVMPDSSFVVQKYNVSYAYGLGAVESFSNHEKNVNSAGFVSFSDEETISDYSKKEITELEGSLREIERCSETFKDLRTRVYTGYDCTSKNLKKIFKYDIAHIATHAHSENNHNVGNYFYTRDKDTLDKVFGYEFDNLDCRSTIAILSACETGVGKFESGEGVFSLTRNLLKGGVPSVVKTLWKVDDFSSGELVASFYQNLKSGVDFSSALSNAKRKMITVNPHPYYWSSYVLEGNPFTSFKIK